MGPMDGVLEIGPGAGTLTRCLCEAAGRVAAVEVDRDVLPFLRAATDTFDNLSITEGDVRRLDLAEVCRPLGEGFFVIANIPYNITTPILELLWDGGLPIRQISVMVQKEVADKLLAAPSTPAYSLTSRALSVPDHSAAGTGGACGMLYAAAQGGQRLCAHGYARAAPCACGGRGAFVAYGESGFWHASQNAHQRAQGRGGGRSRARRTECLGTAGNRARRGSGRRDVDRFGQRVRPGIRYAIHAGPPIESAACRRQTA